MNNVGMTLFALWLVAMLSGMLLNVGLTQWFIKSRHRVPKYLRDMGLFFIGETPPVEPPTLTKEDQKAKIKKDLLNIRYLLTGKK